MDNSRPNIIMIITEHWRGDSIGRLGNPAIETPHIDELSGHGVLFTDAYTPCPSCIAARRSIMTGTTPDTHGMLGYRDGCPWPYTRTLAGELAQNGYQTINVGKTHFHPPRLHLGFEELIIPADYKEWIEKKTGLVRGKFAHGVHGNSWMARPSHLDETDMEETWFTNEAMKKLRKRDPVRPFFLCLSFNGAHPPFCPPKAYFDLFINKDIPTPVVGNWAGEPSRENPAPPDVNTWRAELPEEIIRRARAAYYAFLAYIDAQVGRLIEFLGRSGLRNNTLFLFTSDHGEMLGDHHLWRKTYGYNGSANIPFIVSPPRSWDTQENVICNELVGLEDVMPTLLDAAEVDIPSTVEGRSVLEFLRGEAPEWRDMYHHEHSPCYTTENSYQSLTSKEWKYIWNPSTGEEVLFNRKDDPYERADLSGEKEYEAELERWRLAMARKLADRPEDMSDGETLKTADVAVWRDPTES